MAPRGYSRFPIEPGAVGSEVRAPKVAELVAAQLRRRIVKGELEVGEALPSEAELMRQFSVSRATLREALRVLEFQSLITVQRGAYGGARVQEPNRNVVAEVAGLFLEYRHTTLQDVYDARVIVETPCAALLAVNRTSADIARLRTSLAEAEEVKHDPLRLIRAHTEFHALVVSLCGNNTLSLINGMLRRIIDLANWSAVEHGVGSRANERAFRKGIKAHARIVDLIESGDSIEAETLWKTHLVEAEDYLLQGARAKTVLDLLD
jgi:DNA-binding FadR family transcriptional regulator